VSPHINLIFSWLGAYVSTTQKTSCSRQDTIAAAVRGLPGTTAASRRALSFFF